jgi:hypothetical protein
MFTIYFTNFGYASERTFESLEAAASFARSATYDAQILCDGEVVALYSFFGGLQSLCD